ncbi:hypothetical protein BsWGS_07574 [Bradybaena similaris]
MSLQAGRLLTYLLVTCVYVCRGLHLTFERTPDNQFCALLLCDEDVSQSDEEISYLTELSIYNTTLAQPAVKLASVSIFEHGLYVDPHKFNVINGTGSISSSEGHLALSFQDVADCLLGTFLCQMDFVTVSGQPGTTTKSTISGDNGDCSLLEKLLTSRLDNLTLENTALGSNVTQLSGENLNLQSKVTQLSEEKLVLQSSLENATKRIAELEALVNASINKPKVPGCFKGMPSTTSRHKFLLWDRMFALCDTETDGGGWIIIQRRTKGDVDFYKGWADYKNGFGTPSSDFWIGLDVIHNLTSQGFSELRFDLQDSGTNYFEHYSQFTVADELSKYRLSVGEYNGTAGDSLTYHNGQMFTTYDSDNDDDASNCAVGYHGAWWYGDCYDSNLNGQWGVDSHEGVTWNTLTGYMRSLNSIEMKVRQE